MADEKLLSEQISEACAADAFDAISLEDYFEPVRELEAQLTRLREENTKLRASSEWASAEKHSAQTAEEVVRNENYSLRAKLAAAEQQLDAAQNAMRSIVRKALREAAAGCDEIRKGIEEANPGRKRGSVGQIGAATADVAKRCGDAIWALREAYAIDAAEQAAKEDCPWLTWRSRLRSSLMLPP